MKKKGYMLVETLIVSVTVTSILIYLYAQFTNVQIFYNEVYKYNNVNELYLTGTIKNLIVSNNKNILNKLDDAKNICNTNDCSRLNGVNSQALARIINHYKVKNIILAKTKTEDDAKEIKKFIKNGDYSNLMKDFSDAIAYNKDYSYRIIVEFDNGNGDAQVATVLFNE